VRQQRKKKLLKFESDNRPT